MTQKSNRTFTLKGVLTVDEEPIPGVPVADEQHFGTYSGKFPQVAASKAYSNILRYMNKFPDSYPEYTPDLQLLIFIVETTEGKNNGREHIYLGTREEAPQSENGPRVIESPEGRSRSYRWQNKMIPL